MSAHVFILRKCRASVSDSFIFHLKYWYLRSIDTWKILKLEKCRYLNNIANWKVLALEKYWYGKCTDTFDHLKSTLNFLYLKSIGTFDTWKVLIILILEKCWYWSLVYMSVQVDQQPSCSFECTSHTFAYTLRLVAKVVRVQLLWLSCE